MDTDKLKHIFDKFIVTPCKHNLTLMLVIAGVVLVIIGAVTDVQFILTTGSATLGAGVFAAIIKSTQFTNLFQQHISEVFYDPAKVKDGVPLIYKWRRITIALLKDVLPKSHSKAADLIENQFFNSELEYHFENYRITYEISVDKNTRMADVVAKIDTLIVLSPKSENPMLIQALTTGKPDSVQVRRLHLGGKKCKFEDYCKPSKTEKDKFEIEVPLSQFARYNPMSGDRVLDMDRCVTWAQDLTVEPDIEGEVIRYIKGAEIKAKINDGYKILFRKFGLGELPVDHYIEDDGEGFQRWKLAESEDLLLPGQGYILIIVPQEAANEA